MGLSANKFQLFLKRRSQYHKQLVDEEPSILIYIDQKDNTKDSAKKNRRNGWRERRSVRVPAFLEQIGQ